MTRKPPALLNVVAIDMRRESRGRIGTKGEAARIVAFGLDRLV
jgi:hypothetical protein